MQEHEPEGTLNQDNYQVSREEGLRSLASPAWIKLKGVLFLLLGLSCAALLLFEHPFLRDAFFLAVAVWSFCRFYYFAFYVIQNYVDAEYRFSGLLDFAK